MRLEATSRDDYFAAAGDRAEDLRRVDAVVQRHAPDLAPTLSTGMGSAPMLGYGEQPYQTRSMKAPGTWPVIALAAQKRYLSLYVCAIVDGEYLAERYAQRLGSVDCGKSCIRFTTVDKLDLDALAELLEEVNARFVAGETLFG